MLFLVCHQPIAVVKLIPPKSTTKMMIAKGFAVSFIALFASRHEFDRPGCRAALPEVHSRQLMHW